MCGSIGTPPDDFLDKIVDMIADSQGAPFLLNFDERSMAGMLREAKEAGIENLINDTNVHEYARWAAWKTPCAATTGPAPWT
jgi:hypothetical protein